ncbi:hypothetical protein C1H46_020410 [Malus baccata]|uniref:DUF674 family protein n=1 Tax=Malus baccata TaxID=106549 RepID=A0A540M5K2_MALBA|nr:hypothetical protein C1H46_020410 [Malus baccata]
MADETARNIISLKALVDKERNNVIFIESDNDFIDVLFSFLTIPMGTIVRNTRKHSVPMEIGCMSNLYASVENIDVQHLQTEACRRMLLCPHGGVEHHCENLKLKIDDDEPTGYFLCDSWQCTFDNKLLSHYKGVLCQCGAYMNVKCRLSGSSASEKNGGIFVNEFSGLIVTDGLHLISPFSVASNPLFMELGVMSENSATEELTLNVGVDEVLNLLKRSFVSKKPLTETLLGHNPKPELLSNANLNQRIRSESLMLGGDMILIEEEEKKISVKLTVSRSRNIVCYAEAEEDFVNLLFGFLTVPLGFIVKHMREASSKGCIDQLYKSVQDLDEQYLKSNYHKDILLNPKLYPGFCYENYLLGVEDGSVASYYYAFWNEEGRLRDILTTDKKLIPSVAVMVPLKLLDSKNPHGYLKGSSVFMITDKLIIRPISPLWLFGFERANCTLD